jgi:preprotein translocase subunit SecD
MLEYARWKYAIIVLVTLLAGLYALPNVYRQDPAVQISANRTGVVNAALKTRVQGALEKQAIGFKNIEINESSKRLLVRLVDAEAQLPARQAISDELKDDYNVALNLAPTVPQWLVKFGAKAMSLGLDLQGGVHFLMQVDQGAVDEQQYDRYADEIRSLFKEKKLRYRSVMRQGKNIVISARDAKEKSLLLKEIEQRLPQLELTEGVSTAESVSLNAKIKAVELRAALNNALQQNVATLRNRINAIGVAEPIIQQQGQFRVVVQLPGVQDTAAAKRILGATATLEYRAVDMQHSAADALNGKTPPESKLYYDRNHQPHLLSKRIIVAGDQLIDAASGFDPQDGSPSVSVVLDDVGAQRMLDFTNNNVGKGMAVVFIERLPDIRLVDGKEVRTTKVKEEIISIANVREPFGKRFQTTGLDSATEAAELALLLRSGALAAPMDIVEERIVGPSLGRDNIERGWKAVIYSFMFVLLFFIFYYRVFGVVTNVALLLNLLLVIAVMSILGATLTLPGLAGIALTVGMSVDANVLINERIREELRLGNSPLSSIREGYEKASGTIVDANVTALLAGLALFAFGSGPIKGFAISLCVGILSSMYTAVSVSRAVATFIYGRRHKLKTLSI